MADNTAMQSGRYKAYPEYKDSGVKRLELIPKSWKNVRLKNVLKIRNGRDYKDVEVESGGYPVYGSGGIFKRSSKYLFDGKSVLFGRKGTIDKPLLVSGRFWTVDTMFYSEISENAIPEYIYYQSLSFPFDLLTTNTALPSMTQEDLLELDFILPSNIEQRQIIDFLDHETAKIDTLIEKQQRLIELLTEKRQAVISHAVTKGLNPDVPMKESGVEWLGDVPKHWEISKLKWQARTTSGGTPTTSKYELYYEKGDIPWIRTTDLNNDKLYETPIKITSRAVSDSACSILPVDSVLLAMYGGAGSIGKHSLLKFESTINQAVCGILPSYRFVPDYLHRYYEFYRPFWMVGAAGTRKDPNIGQDTIKEGLVLIPPYKEQQEIAKYIDVMNEKYEDLTEKANLQIQLMQERRTALISAAVTGKIDVRDWTADS